MASSRIPYGTEPGEQGFPALNEIYRGTGRRRIPQQLDARQIYRDRMTSPHVHQREGEVPPAAALHRLVDPDHSERLQQARVLQRAGIDWLETELTDELHHSRLPAGIVAGDQHDGLDRIVGRLGHIARTRRVERLEDKGA